MSPLEPNSLLILTVGKSGQYRDKKYGLHSRIGPIGVLFYAALTVMRLSIVAFRIY